MAVTGTVVVLVLKTTVVRARVTVLMIVLRRLQQGVPLFWPLFFATATGQSAEQTWRRKIAGARTSSIELSVKILSVSDVESRTLRWLREGSTKLGRLPFEISVSSVASLSLSTFLAPSLAGVIESVFVTVIVLVATTWFLVAVLVRYRVDVRPNLTEVWMAGFVETRGQQLEKGRDQKLTKQ